MEEFIKYFADQFDETDASVFTSETEFHELEEWGSLTGLAILNMIAKKYGVKVKPDELKNSRTISDVYSLIMEKK